MSSDATDSGTAPPSLQEEERTISECRGEWKGEVRRELTS